jgi:hypothetical protein
MKREVATSAASEIGRFTHAARLSSKKKALPGGLSIEGKKLKSEFVVHVDREHVDLALQGDCVSRKNNAGVAGLVPATSIVFALCLQIRGRQDKPSDDAHK